MKTFQTNIIMNYKKTLVIILSLNLLLFYSTNDSLANEMKADKAYSDSNYSDCELLYSNLLECKELQCKKIDNNHAGNFVTHYIKGLDNNGLCIHEQFMDYNNSHIKCNYSENSRKFLAISIIKTLETDYQPTSEEKELNNKLMADIFSSECEVINE